MAYSPNEECSHPDYDRQFSIVKTANPIHIINFNAKVKKKVMELFRFTTSNILSL